MPTINNVLLLFRTEPTPPPAPTREVLPSAMQDGMNVQKIIASPRVFAGISDYFTIDFFVGVNGDSHSSFHMEAEGDSYSTLYYNSSQYIICDSEATYLTLNAFDNGYLVVPESTQAEVEIGFYGSENAFYMSYGWFDHKAELDGYNRFVVYD